MPTALVPVKSLGTDAVNQCGRVRSIAGSVGWRMPALYNRGTTTTGCTFVPGINFSVKPREIAQGLNKTRTALVLIVQLYVRLYGCSS